MRKWILSVMCVLVMTPGALAQEETEPSRDSGFILGAAAIMSTSPYKGDDSQVFGVPVIVWSQERAYIKGDTLGWIFNENEWFQADLILKPRFGGYDSDDSPDLNGMQDRDISLDGGVRLSWKFLGESGFALDTTFLSDLLSEHEGQEVDVGFSYTHRAKIFQLVPSVGVKWSSEALNDYYFGVRPSEAAAGRSAYEPDDDFSYYASLGFNMGLSRNWLLITRVSVEAFGDEVKDSPIVDEDYQLSGLLGIARRF